MSLLMDTCYERQFDNSEEKTRNTFSPAGKQKVTSVFTGLTMNKDIYQLALNLNDSDFRGRVLNLPVVITRTASHWAHQRSRLTSTQLTKISRFCASHPLVTTFCQLQRFSTRTGYRKRPFSPMKVVVRWACS